MPVDAPPPPAKLSAMPSSAYRRSSGGLAFPIPLTPAGGPAFLLRHRRTPCAPGAALPARCFLSAARLREGRFDHWDQPSQARERLLLSCARVTQEPFDQPEDRRRVLLLGED